MRYIDRRFLFPVAAVTAWAQQPAPSAAQAEAAVRARVEEYYKLQVDKKFRQAESMVAEDSKDNYYSRTKQDIKGFSIQQIELLDNNTRAKVTTKGKVILRAALLGAQEFEFPLVSNWKLENGEWFWYVDRETAGQTPFGKIQLSTDGAQTSVAPIPSVDIATLRKQVTMDRSSVTLSASTPEETVTFTNHMEGPITLELIKPLPVATSIELEKSDLKAGETSAMRFRLITPEKGSAVVQVRVAQLNEVFEIQVQSK